MLSPMPTWTAKSGPSIAPASAHSAAPIAKTIVKTRFTRTPITRAISRLEAPARTSMPSRVCETST